MGKPSEAKRKWVEELGAMVGGATSARSLEPGADEFSPAVGVAAEPLLSNLLGEQSVRRFDGAGGSPKLPKSGKTTDPQPKATSAGLPKKAKVTRLRNGRYQYDFGRPITKEQAAQVIFRDGKVPSGARLLPGPGDTSWTLETVDQSAHEFDMDGHQATLRKMRARTQTVDPGKPGEMTEEWADGPSKGSADPKPADSKNKLGFWVNKKYDLDTGQLPDRLVRLRLHSSEGAVGYEVIFDKAMTKDEVMDKLFVKSAPKDYIILLPMGGSEPTTYWIVQVVGAVALGSFNRSVISAFLYNPKTDAKESTQPGVPDGMRKHIENKTVPKDAVKHPPDVYIWEEAGFLVRVETDTAKGGGKYYKFETTKIGHAGKGDQDFIRDLVIKKGIRPKEAWEEYTKKTAEMIKAIAQAKLEGGGMGGMRVGLPRGGPAPKSPIKPPDRGGQTPPGAPKGPNTIVRSPPPPPTSPPKPGGSGGSSPKTIPGHPPPMPRSQRAPNVPDVPPPARPSTDPGKAPTPPAPPRRPERGRPLDSTPPVTRPGDTVDTSSPKASSRGGNSNPRPTHLKGTPVKPAPRLPDDQKIRIKTSNGSQEMTVGEYRSRWRKAKEWLSQETRKLNQQRGAPEPRELIKKAQKEFGLDDNWLSVGNPYIDGKL